MKENKGVGPNLKTYYYYTNEMAESDKAKAAIVIATGMEGTGALYDEIGAYLDQKGYAMYAIDEWGYGKTGALVKTSKKNWDRKGFYYASYNIHALSVLAKSKHQNVPLYLIGNDFGAMLSIYLLKEFPEVVDKLITIGWGVPRARDYGFWFTSWIKKIFLYDSGVSKLTHKSMNKRFAFRFERGEKYAWLSRDLDQVKKIKDAEFIDVPGTVGHYYYYFSNKAKIPMCIKLKKMDKKTPMLFVSGNEDLFTRKGANTKALAKHFESRGFNNVESMILDGRHQLLFEINKYDVVDNLLGWLENGEVSSVAPVIRENIEIVVAKDNEEIVETVEQPTVVDVVGNEPIYNGMDDPKDTNPFMEAEEDLLINTNKESR